MDNVRIREQLDQLWNALVETEFQDNDSTKGPMVYGEGATPQHPVEKFMEPDPLEYVHPAETNENFGYEHPTASQVDPRMNKLIEFLKERQRRMKGKRRLMI